MLTPTCEECAKPISARQTAVEVQCGQRNHLLGLVHRRCMKKHIINLSAEDFAEFERILAEPPKPNDKLVKLMRGDA